jgi:hypothetical protein
MMTAGAIPGGAVQAQLRVRRRTADHRENALEIYLQNSRHERMSEKIEDDSDRSFLSLCREAPENHVLRGVQEIGDTMFNELQCRRLQDELSRVPEGNRTQVVRRVTEMARQAASGHGYLYIAGD